MTTPNVSYYLPDYKPVNPEVPVVHGLPSAPKPKVEKLHIKNSVLSIMYQIENKNNRNFVRTKPKYYPETEKPYVPLELTTPNVSYYLPDYKPVNPEVPVVHGLPSAPKPKVEKLHIKNSVLSITYKIAVRGHSTTTWTRRGGGGSAQSPHLSTQGGGGSQDVHVDKNFNKGTKESWQMTMKILYSSIFVQL